MAYLKINGYDFSPYVKGLAVTKNAIYNQQTNAAGNGVVDYINTKREIGVTIIPINSEVMQELQNAIDAFNVEIDYRNPKTAELEVGVKCIIPTDTVEYYTIQADNVLYHETELTFIEL